jgi:DNA polymerase III subunit epsilon
MMYRPDHQAERAAAAEWAYRLLKRTDWCVMDTETTGLDRSAEIVQVAILAHDGTILMDTLVKPTCLIPPGATAIHGITDAMVADAQGIQNLVPAIQGILADRLCVIYNASFDTRMLRQSCLIAGCPVPIAKVYKCAMREYARWYGAWNDWHGSYTYQKLPGGGHSALDDCQATLRIIKGMASTHLVVEGTRQEEGVVG